MKNKILKKNKYLFILLGIITAGVFYNSFSFALEPPLPFPDCEIKGVIKSVEFRETEELPDPFWGRIWPQHYDGYFLDIRIDSVVYLEGSTDFGTCEDLYPIGETITPFISQEGVNPSDIFSAGQNIEIILTGAWADPSYNLIDEGLGDSDYETIKDTTDIKDEDVIDKEIVQLNDIIEPEETIAELYGFIIVLVFAFILIILYLILKKKKE